MTTSLHTTHPTVTRRRRHLRHPVLAAVVAGAAVAVSLPLAATAAGFPTPPKAMSVVSEAKVIVPASDPVAVGPAAVASAPRPPIEAPAPPPPPPPPPPSPPPVVEDNGRSLGTFEITCYALDGTTASGHPVSANGVAVDPSVIPLGTEVHIEGLGWKVARDTGHHVNGHRIDIWKPSHDACVEFGRQHREVSVR